jgi:predicted O-methyltransferase YrrM
MVDFMNKVARNLQKSFLLFHKIGLKVGLQLLPNHYYSSYADINYLERNKELWAKRSDLPGIKINLKNQVKNLKKICLPFKEEYIGNKVFLGAVKGECGSGFGYIEAQVLHSIIRYYKPKKIIEIGSGVSTYCSLNAIHLNKCDTDYKFNMTCIEPNPSKKLQLEKKVELIKNDVQKVPLDLFENLQEDDLLFIDSTHTVKPGSDVNYLILEVLPRLQHGVIIHFHDIFFPYDYQRDVLQTFFQWNENSLLRSYLTYNNTIEILFCLSMLHYEARDALKEVFPEYVPQKDKNGLVDDYYKPFQKIKEHFPSSIYLKVNKT